MTLADWYQRLKDGMREQAAACAKQAKEWAVDNHPWENVKGEAEKHLTGYVLETGDKIGFGLGHGMKYGKYLETAHDGDYAICDKAVQHVTPQFSAQVKNMMKSRPSG